MTQTLSVNITGTNARPVSEILVTRLSEMGCHARVEPQAGSTNPCVKIEAAFPIPGTESLSVEVDDHDTPDFAAEKIIDTLAECGAVSLEKADYTPEEEEQIRKRLQDLGYIE